MPTIVFINERGKAVSTNAQIGISAMKAAQYANIDGITGDCGGSCSCGTCHVYVAPEWLERAGPRGMAEGEMLSYTENVTEFSRLSCQIDITAEMDGLILTVAPV